MINKKFTADTIIVSQINRGMVIEMVRKQYKPKENEILKTNTVALVDDNVVTDNECCYAFLDKKLINEKVQHVYIAPIYVDIKTENGETHSTTPTFYFDIPEDLFPIVFTESKSLKDFMVGRFNYNPRIKKNTQKFINAYNQ